MEYDVCVPTSVATHCMWRKMPSAVGIPLNVPWSIQALPSRNILPSYWVETKEEVSARKKRKCCGERVHLAIEKRDQYYRRFGSILAS